MKVSSGVRKCAQLFILKNCKRVYDVSKFNLRTPELNIRLEII
jgi:hypothetical protein